MFIIQDIQYGRNYALSNTVSRVTYDLLVLCHVLLS